MGKNLVRSTAASEWIAQRAIEKTEELVAGNSRLKAIKSKLEACLKKGQLYEAANLIASKNYGVGVRIFLKKKAGLTFGLQTATFSP